MFDSHKKTTAILFAATDIVLLGLCFEAAYQVRVYLPLPLEFFIASPVKILILGFGLLSWLGSGFWMGVYDRLYVHDPRAAVYDTLRQVLFTTLALVMFQFLFNLNISRVFIGLFASFSVVALILYRVSAGPLRGHIRRRFGAEIYHVVVGSGDRAIEIGRQVEAARNYGMRLLTFIDTGTKLGQTVRLESEYPVQPLDELPSLLRREVIDEIIFTVEREELGELEDIFIRCDEEGVRTRVMLDFFPHVHSRVYLEHFGAVPLLTFSASPHDEVRLLIKRLADVIVAATALAVLAIPMLIILALVRATSQGPAIFRQVRCGLNGRRFGFYKFRSMVENAEELKSRLAHLNERDGPVFKIAKDPRLTVLGHYLRRFSIDEWPQFWNILKGDMSFVGPRPAVPSEVAQYETWQRRRLRMRPGLTCLWAIRGRDRVDFDTWMKLDLEYINNWSLWLDAKILLQSIPQVLAGRGAH